ncbi:unnamed protein product [Adineta steineri]|uniref:RRM domain-containing protein n=1 Tax=Adineta steineri TaxID=433720 RepID=A0A818L3P8_9BILA|nr:unnamed protein product [Adineta steineri]CAF3565326.1 unnamed protein product [Adineta steineri]
MHSPFEENANSRTLYVGNLDPSVSEELLMALFTQMGPCKNCKIIHEPTSDPYAFIEFTEHQAAANALLAMNKRLVMGKEIKVNWATTSTSGTVKVDTSKHFHIFVGDLAPEIDQNAIREAFSPFGEISEVKIAKFTDTQKPKGYCFVSFTNQSDAETAITSMNGQWLGTRKIRTNWATRKAPTNEPTTGTRSRDSNNSQYGQESLTAKLDFNEVWNRTSDTNSTVYFGNCGDVSEDLVRSFFEQYGPIVEVRVFKEKGYAFIRYATKDSACQAICHIHGSDIHGYTVKCGWGRDEPTNTGNNPSSYGSTMNNQNYNNNNQYDSYSQNSYGPPSNNTYMGGGGGGGGNNGGYAKYGGNYPQQQQQQQQQYFNPQQQWNNNGAQSWDSYSQSASSGGWNNNNNNNNNNYGPNSNQYYGQQQSHMYSSNSGWGRSQR